MGIGTEHLDSYRSIFIHQSDRFAQQTATGSYFLRTRPVRNDIVRGHLKGLITAGWYALSSDSTTGWVCLDADRKDGREQLQEAWTQLDRGGISGHLELSRRGGHLWVLFEPISAQVARRLVLGALPDLEGIEVFPKQERLSGSGIGSLVRGPLGVHRLTGERYPFVDPISLVPVSTTVQGTIEYLDQVPKLTAAQVAEHLARLLGEAKRPPRLEPPHSPGRLARHRRWPATEVKERIGDLRSFVSRYVELDDYGRGPCPFHPPDRNASFSVHPSGFFTCFHEINPRTGRYFGGDAITFYMRLKGLPFRDAIEELRAMVGEPTEQPTRSPPKPI